MTWREALPGLLVAWLVALRLLGVAIPWAIVVAPLWLPQALAFIALAGAMALGLAFPASAFGLWARRPAVGQHERGEL